MYTRTALSLVALGVFFVSSGTLQAKSPAVGYWKAKISYQEQEPIEYYVDLHQKGGELAGALISPRSGEHPISSGSVDSDKLAFSVKREYEGTAVLVEIAGKITGDKFKGAVSVEGNEFGEISMTRLPDPIGTWKVTSERPDGGDPFKSTLVLERGEKGFRGVIKTERFEVKVRKAAWKADDLQIQIALENDGNEVPIQIKARFDGKHKLTGKWSAQAPGGEEFSGGWNAARKPKATDLATFLGKWEATSTLEDGREIEYALILAKSGDKLTGKVESQRGSTDLREVKVKGKKLTFILNFTRQDDTMRIDFVAELASDGSLKGKWETENGAGGEWKAKKKAEKKTEEKKETRL